MLRLFIITFLIFLPANSYAKKLKVVTTFSILYDITEEIVGDRVELKTLVAKDSDIHSYQATPADIKMIAEADLLITNGLDLEGWIVRFVPNKKNSLVVVSDGIRVLKSNSDHEHEHHHDFDPHAWQNVANVKIYVANITKALISADKANAKFYQKRADSYLKKLSELDLWIKSEIAKIPANKRKVITLHNAFQYYDKAYGVEFISPLENTESQASAKTIAGLIDVIREEKVRVVFMENFSDPRLLKQLETDAGAVIGGVLYSDILPEGMSYLDMIKNNTLVLVKGMEFGARH